jgi:hypothetical protein
LSMRAAVISKAAIASSICGLTPVDGPTSQRELGAGKGGMAAGAGGRHPSELCGRI